MRVFETGATRDDDELKPDYEGFLSPLVIKRFGEYMTTHRVQVDGGIRASDNWQKGIPKDAYIKSAFRHFVDWWVGHRQGLVDEASLCALLFNIQGYLHEMLRDREDKNLINERLMRSAIPKSWTGDPPVCLCHTTWNKCPAHD